MIMKVRALVDCFVGGVRRKAGYIFELPEGIKPSAKGMAVIGADEALESAIKAPQRGRKKAVSGDIGTMSELAASEDKTRADEALEQ